MNAVTYKLLKVKYILVIPNEFDHRDVSFGPFYESIQQMLSGGPESSEHLKSDVHCAIKWILIAQPRGKVPNAKRLSLVSFATLIRRMLLDHFMDSEFLAKGTSVSYDNGKVTKN